MYNKVYYKNRDIDNLIYQNIGLIPQYDISTLFSNNEQGFWYDPNPKIKEGWKVNYYTNTNDLTYLPNRATITKTEDGFLFTATDVIAGGNTLLGLVYPAGASTSVINGKTIVRSIEVKKGTANILRFGAAADGGAVFIDLNTMTVSRNAGNLLVVINALSNGWYKVETFNYQTTFGTATLSNSVGWGMSHTSSTLDSTDQVGSTINLRKPSFTVVNGDSTVSIPYQEVLTERDLFLSQNENIALFQDSIGSVPVTSADQPVGLILDKSKGLALGTELAVNGNFDDLSNWLNVNNPSKSVQGSMLRLESTSAQFPSGIYQDIVLPNYKACKVVVRARKLSGTSDAKIVLVPRTGDFNLPNSPTSITSSEFKTYTLYIAKEPAATGIRVYFQMFMGDAVIEIDSISVKEIAGNHAYQSASASRPMLRYNTNSSSYYLAFDGIDDYLQVDGLTLPSPMSTVFAADTSSSPYSVLLSAGTVSYINLTPTGIGLGGGTSITRKTPKDVLYFKANGGKYNLKSSLAEIEVTSANTFTTNVTKYIGIYAPSASIKFNGNIYGMVAVTKTFDTTEENQLSAIFNRRLGV